MQKSDPPSYLVTAILGVIWIFAGGLAVFFIATLAFVSHGAMEFKMAYPYLLATITFLAAVTLLLVLVTLSIDLG